MSSLQGFFSLEEQEKAPKSLEYFSDYTNRGTAETIGKNEFLVLSAYRIQELTGQL
jgi:hypothetical protein